jgi:hypothetical protein
MGRASNPADPALACTFLMAYQKAAIFEWLTMRGWLVLLGLVLFSSIAAADTTRDEVMSGAARCAGLTDNRVSLDCFYGSAQPMRALLGLSPAPPAQVKLVPPPGAVYPTAGATRGLDEVLSGAGRCAGLADNRTWLDCFYGSAQPMRELLGLPPAPYAQVRLVPPLGAVYARSDITKRVPAEKSGSFVADILGSSKPIASDVPMASYKFGRDGKFTVVLKNGQTYRQEEYDMVLAKWNRAPDTYLVTIIGASDKFVLKVKGQPGVHFRVRRM